MSTVKMENIMDQFKVFTEKPVKYLTVQNDIKEDLKFLVKSIYDYTKSQEQDKNKEKQSALPELIVKDFDEEQIWQQIELQNTECWDKLVWEVANCMSIKNDLVFPVETEDSDKISLEFNEQSLPSEEDNSILEDHDDEQEQRPKKKQESKFKPSIVDDKFFKLQEMEKFLLNEEKNENKKGGLDSDDESIDMFEEIDDEDSEDEEGRKDMMYGDFFAENDVDDNVDNQDLDESGDNEQNRKNTKDVIEKQKEKRVRFAEETDDDDDESMDKEIDFDHNDDSATNTNDLMNGKLKNDEKKSEFELRQQRLKQQIDRLEDKALKEAPWQLKGEVDAMKRPQNSLLQEVVDFDLTSRPPPIITEQTTITLEDIIKQRIKDKAWDDVIKKEKPVDDQLSFRKKEILDHSKSKQSLAEIYEAEFLRQKKALSGEVQEENEPESHTEIRNAMSKLFSKLDALSHYHYTPKPPQAEVKIVSNTPAIAMEEVAPTATSDATLLAPEEVKKKRRGELMSKEERTETDKKRERRKKKKLQKQKGPIAKITDAKNTKKGVEATDKSLKTSKAFFQQLNDDTTSIIKKNKRNVKNKGQ